MINELIITRAETEKDYRMRCYIYKLAHPEVTWKEIADTMNNPCINAIIIN